MTPLSIFADGPTLFDNIRQDFRRFRDDQHDYGPLRARLNVFFKYGFIAIMVFRYGRWTRTIRPKILSYPFKLIYKILQFFIDVMFGIHVSANCDIGPGFYIGHFGGIIVHGNMGANCSIGQGVTIGTKGAGRSNGIPQLGDNVYVGAGAKVIGRITIGNDVVIGANTVVVKDVPDGMRVTGGEVRMAPMPPRAS